MRLVALALFFLTLSAHAQHGMSGLAAASHPRIWFTSARLTAAQDYYALHPWSLPSNVIDNAALYAAHSLITATPSECTTAKDTAIAYMLTLSGLQISAGAATDNADDKLRYYGEILAEVYDWCNSSFDASEKQFYRDRWLGTTSGVSDPVRVITDLAATANSYVVTSSQGKFLANMADNNLLIFTGSGGTNCPPGGSVSGTELRWIIHIVTDSNTVTLATNSYGPPNTAANMSGCTARVSGPIDASRFNAWGAANMPWSNYNLAFTRNDFMWAIATYGESTYAADLLDDWETRWTTHLAYKAGASPYTSNSQKGGQWVEGVEYGLQGYLYQIMPLFVAPDFGRSLPAETNWYKESAIFTIYNSTLKATSNQNGGFQFQHFPWDDNQAGSGDFEGYPSGSLATSVMSLLGNLFGSTNLAKYTRQYVAMVGDGLAPIRWAPDTISSVLALSGLPLDYYASGTGVLFTKNTWTDTATQVKVLTATDNSAGHYQAYPGEFQILRNGYWFTKNFTVYASSGNASLIKCPGYSATGDPTAVDTCDAYYGYAHNTISFGPLTPTGCNTAISALTVSPGISRLQSTSVFAYMAANLTAAYYNGELFGGTRPCRDNNPYVDTVVREYLFVKPLETLIILDRVKSGYNPQFEDTHPVLTAAHVVKTAFIHSPVAPTISSNTATWDNGTQRLKGWFFSNETTTDLANVDEGNFTGHETTPNFYQQRLEISNSTAVTNSTAVAQTYLVHVLKTGAVSGWANFSTATLTDNGNSTWTLRLDHADGNVLFTFATGATSTGGTFGYATSGTPTQTALRTDVNGPTVNDNGVGWPVSQGGYATGNVAASGNVVIK